MTNHRAQSAPVIGIYVIAFPRVSETFIVTKVLGLLDAGFEVEIFTLSESCDWDKFQILAERNDIRARVHIAPPANGVINLVTRGIPQFLTTASCHPREFARFIRYCWNHREVNPAGFLRSLFRRIHMIGYKLDLIHIEFDTQGALIVDMKYFKKCKLLLSSRGSARRTNVTLDIMKYAYSHADYYHSISHYLAHELSDLGLPKATPIKLIEPSISLSLFQSLSPRVCQTEVLSIVTVARLGWEKGYEFALDALRIVRDAGVAFKYLIAGEGEYRQAIEFAVRQHDLVNDVILKGSVPRDQIVGVYHEADIFLHLSLDEGFCNAVIEAQAMQIPVVVSDAGGLPENVEDGVTGFVVPRRDPKAAAEKILQLARDPELRIRMGKAGRKRVEERFNLTDQIQKFSALYHEMLSSSKQEV